MQTLTYGDTLALPSVPDVLWRVTDIRSLEEAGNPNESRAELRPFHLDGVTAYGYDEPVKIGRASRVGVSIVLTMRRPYDRASDTYGAPELRAYARTRSYAENLTDAQRGLLEREAGDIFAFSYILPPLDAAEIRARIVEKITDDYRAYNAARETVKNAPNLYTINRGDQANNPAQVIRDAFDNPEGAEALRLALDDATELYRSALAKELRTFGTVAG